MASIIGIKIANGEFYPVVEEGSTIKKRLVLTTVHDGQRSVQIDLYRSAAKSMSDAVYIGSLVVEDIAPKQKGEPSIELVIGADGNQELSAEAVDLDPGSSADRQKLTVSLQALNEEDRSYEMPDFELETDTQPPSALYDNSDLPVANSTRQRGPTVLYVLLGVAALLLLFFLLWLFVLRPRAEKPQPVPEPLMVAPMVVEPPVAVSPVIEETTVLEEAEAVLPPPPPPPPPAPEPVLVEETPPPVPTPAKRVRPTAPVKSYKIPSVIPKEGYRYKIRWGDTLWDIAEAFYRNPWLYPRIVRFNAIKNPDLIISGEHLLVPPKN